MKHFYAVVLIGLLTTQLAGAQIAYYDAVKLNSYVTSGKFPIPATLCDPTTPSSECIQFVEVIKLIRPYLRDTLQTEDEKVIVAELRNVGGDNYNPFLDPLLGLGSANSSTNFSSIAARAGSFSTKAVNALGNVDVTTLTQGLAIFLVDRAKEELNVAFFEKLQDVLSAYPEFRTLFPRTNVLLNNFAAWEYANLMSTLRESFDKDLGEMLENIIELRNLTRDDCSEDLGKNQLNNCRSRMDDITAFLQSNEGIALLSALQIGNGFSQGKKIPDVLNSITHPDFLLGLSFPANVPLETNLKSSVQLVNIISMSLRSNESGRHYISSAEFSALVSGTPLTTLQRIYLGLIYQQVLNANLMFDVPQAGGGFSRVSVISLLQSALTNGTNVLNYLTQLRASTERLQGAYENLVTAVASANGDLSSKRIALFATAQQLMQAVTNIDVIHPSLVVPDELDVILDLSSRGLQIVENIKSRNYNGALIEVLAIISEQVDKRTMADGTNLNPRIKQFLGALLKYGSFAANVVNSKDPEEVKEAIKALALPAGSASMKKRSNFSLSLNAYVGFVWGEEKPIKGNYTVTLPDGTTENVKLNGGKAVAVYAPIGIGANWGLGWRRKHPWSISAYLSVIDIGAMVGYRFTNDSTFSNTPNVKLANIFSPGLNVAVGLPSVPITVGFGVQRIATLQRNPSSNDVYNVDFAGWRFPQVFIAVDIPIMNFHTGKKTLLHAPNRR